jgi:hypothetical protein
MKFKFCGKMQSKPHMKVDASIDPVQFSTAMDGGFSGSLGPFRGGISDIPVRMAIPFMKRRRLPVVAAFGGFRGRLDAFRFAVDSCSMGFNGTLGTKGIRGKMDCHGECESGMEAAGTISGKVGVSHPEPGEEEHGQRAVRRKRAKERD